MTDDLHDFARRIDALDEIIADANADKAAVYQEAKKVLREDLPAFRDAMTERRRRDKNPAAYQALKGRAAELLDALDNGVVVEHARTPARARERTAAYDVAAPEAASGKGDPAAADPIDPSTAGSHLSPHAGNDTAIPSAPKSPVVETPSPSGVEPQLAGTSGFPATPSPSVDSVPVGEPDPDDSDWERRDGAATYDGVRQIQRNTLVASGAARLHPAEIDITLPDRLRRA